MACIALRVVETCVSLAMTFTVMVYTVMAYVVIAYTVIAFIALCVYQDLLARRSSLHRTPSDFDARPSASWPRRPERRSIFEQFRRTPTASTEGQIVSERGVGKVSAKRVLRHLRVDTGPRRAPSACAEMSAKSMRSASTDGRISAVVQMSSRLRRTYVVV